MLQNLKLLKISALALAMGASSLLAQAAEVTGAGASFPAPLYAKWADAYQKATGNRINYQSIGSGGGIKQITARTVDFGASDMPLKPADLNKNGLTQFPAVIGGVVPVVHVQGVQPGALRLNGQVLADIYLGKIRKWNDPAIAALNPGLRLPSSSIAVVRRADGSGTTFIFTNYLSKVSPEWKQRVGEGTAVRWPSVSMGGKGNEGVAAFMQRIPNSIGYVEYAYAKQNRLAWVQLQNAAGNFVAPNDHTFKAAAAGAHWERSNFGEILTNQSGNDSWPITGATFILMHKSQQKPTQGAEALKFFQWAFKNGGQMATDLQYVPLPSGLVKQIYGSWKTSIKDPAGKPVYVAK